MGHVMNTSLRYLRAGGFWVSVLLILPNCGFESGALGNGPNLKKGAYPHNSVVFCDIEKALGRRCATTTDLAIGIRLSEAAIALNEGRSSNVGLDDSAAALARCGGEPEAILYEGPFPQGFPVCLNCGVLGSTETPDANAVCQRQCFDFYGTVVGEEQFFLPDNPPHPSVKTFCEATARVSTNMSVSTCLPGACSNDGTLLTTGWSDPRRLPEPVIWDDLIGVIAGTGSGYDLQRVAPTTGSFDAGAVSRQRITRGDGFVEFGVPRADQAVALGLTEIPPGCADPCPDTNPSRSGIGFAIAMGETGLLYVFNNGVQVTGPGFDGSFGTYTANDRFRVRLRDNGNGTATVSYVEVEGSCTPGTRCTQRIIYTQPGVATYPVRVDASLFHSGAVLADVRLVRLQ